jgi:aryl-alcohol dehydrogenase-like predicted oxidoreductase
MQDQYSLLQREDEREMFGLLADQGVASMPWCPLASGRLARPFGRQTRRSDADPAGNRFFGAGDRLIIDAVQATAQAKGVAMAQVALAWVLRNPVVAAPVVAGATDPHHLDDAASALEIRLTAAEAASLEAPYTIRQPTRLTG